MTKKEIATKILAEACRVILGVTFVFSGFVKAVDPLGTAYKIQDYFTAMGTLWLHPAALPLSIAQSVIEFLLGVWLLLGIYRRFSARLLLLVMLFMTPLTLYLAFKNPVHDCGCFGDFLIITNWQTFYKNIVLLACAIAVLVWSRRLTPLFSVHVRWMAALFTFAYIFAFCIYSYVFLPVFDFRPYRIGTDLHKLVSEKAEADVYANTFVYEKNGKRQTFTEDNYPWQDPTWKFVDSKSVLVKAGKKSDVGDFGITRLTVSPDMKSIIDEADVTDSVLTDPSYTFLMVAYSLKDMSEAHLGELEDLASYAQEHKYKFYCLTASSPEDILAWIDDTGASYSFGLTDERVLKTMIRSNPGLILMKGGKIINKWPGNRIPKIKKTNAPLEQLTLAHPADRKQAAKHKMLILCIIFALPLVLMQAVDISAYKWPWRRPRQKNGSQQADKQ